MEGEKTRLRVKVFLMSINKVKQSSLSFKMFYNGGKSTKRLDEYDYFLAFISNLRLLTFTALMKAGDTRSSNSVTGVYRLSIFSIC